MPIYARNSLGSDVKITANENYSYADMGRILSECVQNDQTLFNAVLLNDFKENAAIREGTMVSSELQSFREFSVKEAWGGLKKKLQKLWEKIKGVFRQVYAKLLEHLHIHMGQHDRGMHLASPKLGKLLHGKPCIGILRRTHAQGYESLICMKGRIL